MNVLIVGSGLFGSVAAALLKKNRIKFRIFDDGREGSGSKPAACLIKPSWVAGLGSAIVEPALETLDDLYGLRTLSFRTRALPVNLLWVPPSSILSHAPRRERVMEVGDGWIATEKRVWRGLVLVAAGIWHSALCPGPRIRALTGAALVYAGAPKTNQLSIWAPYKQALSFERDPGLTWFGDGTSILKDNWKDSRITDSRKRARTHGLTEAPAYVLVGHRPYCPEHRRGYFAQVYPQTWCVTGGAKNGTVLAAYYARKFLEAIE